MPKIIIPMAETFNVGKGSLAHFQLNEAIGTVTNPHTVNDGDLETALWATEVGHYVEIDLGRVRKVNQYRHYGHERNENNGYWKIQAMNPFNGEWADVEIDILTRVPEWSTMFPMREVNTRYLRIVCTTLDSADGGRSRSSEWEIYHD